MTHFDTLTARARSARVRFATRFRKDAQRFGEADPGSNPHGGRSDAPGGAQQ
jgi:hypothetical protein